MTPIEIIATILIIASAIKIVVILIKPSSWANMIKKVWINPMIMSGISLVLAAVVLYYLLQEVTIVQILAVTAFIGLFMAVGIGMYAKEVISMANKMLKKGIMKKAWLYTILWIVLLAWGAKELFM
jgi:hypothetical protein